MTYLAQRWTRFLMCPILINIQSSAVFLPNIMAEYLDPASFYRIRKFKVFLQLGSVQEDPPTFSLYTSVSVFSDQERTKAPLQATQGRIYSEIRLKTTCKKTPPRKHPCPITEMGCEKSMFQLSNLKSHMKAKLPNVTTSTTLCASTAVEHPPTQKQTLQTKRRRKISKRPLSPPLPPIVSPSDDDSDVFPPPPTGRFPVSPLAPPLRKPLVELLDFITIPLSAFPKDEPEPPRSPSHCRPQWYCAKVQGPQPQVQPDPEVPVRRCHLTTRGWSTVHKKGRDACGIERAHQLPSTAPSSSSTGESSRSSLGRFPLPPPPPPTGRLITPAFAFNKLPSPSSSRTPSPTFEIPFSLSRGSPKVQPTRYSQ
ncbi:hypothetical protein ARMSODRAFT_1020022 [Armillaria solidipes]|uniref:Uncharacterized protein n=1 Tax=Armillaria solidipes TaxID=1076256 RepID=A0A2H3BTR7_9AGAR|nr:hypothetical protein ARMSODRAFT_1020022 [Armillaria solidipes]